MSTLRISIAIPHVNEVNVPVTTEILNEDLERLETLIVSREATSETDLAPGNYLVRALLPSGEIRTVPVQVGADDEEVYTEIKVSSSPHEWLAWHQMMGDYR